MSMLIWACVFGVAMLSAAMATLVGYAARNYKLQTMSFDPFYSFMADDDISLRSLLFGVMVGIITAIVLGAVLAYAYSTSGM